MELVLLETLCREGRTDMVKRFAPFVDPAIIPHGIFEACSAGKSNVVDTLLPFVHVKDRAPILRYALAFDAIPPDIFETLYRGCEKDDIRLMMTCFEKTPSFFRGKKFGEVSEHILAMFRARAQTDFDRDDIVKALDNIPSVASAPKKHKPVL